MLTGMAATRAYKTELDLNDQQIRACKRHDGAARYVHPIGAGTPAGSIQSHREKSLGHRSPVSHAPPRPPD